MKAFKKFLLPAALVGVLAFAAACGNRDDDAPATGGGAPAGATRIEGGDLQVSLMSMPVSFNLSRNDNASAQFAKQVFETLVHLDYSATDSSLTPIPHLAYDWTIVDPQTVNMTLRSGVYFHNGLPLRASDVKFSLERAAVCPEASVVSNMIESVTVHNDLEFTIHLNIPFVPIINNLGHVIMGIISEESYRENPAHPVGTGPFVFEYIQTDDYVFLTRNDNYWGTPAIVDTLTFRLIPDSNIRVIEADAGNIHISLDIQPPQIRPAEASTTATLMRRDGLAMNYAGFNLVREGTPFADPRVRRAVNYAVDVEAMIDAVFEGAGRPLQGVPLSDVNRDFTPGLVPPMGFNLERARELMAEAGYADGFDATIWYNIPNVARPAMAEVIAAALRQININVTIEGFEWETYLDRTGNFEHDMFLLGWVSVVGDLDYALHPLFHSSNFGPGGNRFGLQSDQLDDLLDRGRVETDPAVRSQIYADAMILLDEYLPMLLLNQTELMVHVNNHVGGFVIHPAGHNSFARVWLYE